MISIDDLVEVFKVVFDNNELKIAKHTTANDIEAWDSMTHVLLLSAIEERFGVEFH